MRPGPIPEKYISLITKDVSMALIYLHKSGLIHRDIKGKVDIIKLHYVMGDSCEYLDDRRWTYQVV
jgi:serine/threonine protein kinase